MWLIIGTYLLLLKPGSSGFPEYFEAFHRHSDDTDIHKLPLGGFMIFYYAFSSAQAFSVSFGL